jgi:hypothetical protein
LNFNPTTAYETNRESSSFYARISSSLSKERPKATEQHVVAFPPTWDMLLFENTPTDSMSETQQTVVNSR